MENGQEEIKTEIKSESTSEVNDKDTPVTKETDSENKSETETSQKPSPELLGKIQSQIEFYFGDVNMQRDKFLIEQTKLDEGWIPISIMLNFKMLASMSTDVEVILEALKSSDLIEVSEDKKKIRRSLKHPLPVYDEEYRKAQEARTVYVKGFPLLEMNIEKLKAFLEPYESFENIIMRKYQDKKKKLQFKGSIFVQFKSLEDAKGFMARESIKYNDNELIRKWSVDYALEKTKEKEERRQKKSEGKAKKNKNEKEEDKDGNDEENEKDTCLPKGSIIHFSGVSPKCTREDIKECLHGLEASVAFIDFKKGDREGWIRLQGENAAKSVFDKMKDGKISVNDQEVICRVLEGEEEEKYLVKAKEEMTFARQRYNKSKRVTRKSRSVQRNVRKRRHSPHDAVPAKKISAE